LKTNIFQGKLYLERFKADSDHIQQLRTAVKENTDKLVSLKNKRELMTKVIVENDVRKNERAQRMANFAKHIASLPEPGT
jgi:predicted transcriptional regulator